MAPSMFSPILFSQFIAVVFVFFVFVAFMWRYLDGADWGRFNFLRENLLARLLTGIVIAYVFWILLTVSFGVASTWLLPVL
jgi:heme/copper-type cytochrome/quinol oxidase subunit 2